MFAFKVFAYSFILVSSALFQKEDVQFPENGMDPQNRKPNPNDKDLTISGVCDYDHKCPENFVCQHLAALPGTKACVFKDRQFFNSSAKRPGTKCFVGWWMETPEGLRGPGPRRPYCNGHEDCPSDKRCCPVAYGNDAFCSEPQLVPQGVVITPIMIGYQNITDNVYTFISSVTLVQSKGYNVLVDTSSPRTKVLENLWLKAGLLAQDIDMVITSHGHGDHYSNVQLFEDSDHVYNNYTYTWHFHRPNPLETGQRFFLNNDTNLEVVQTPGHTPQDVTLLVRNAAGLGTVALVGDLIATKEDVYDRFAWNRTLSDLNRRKIACSVDYIVPGHGAMFPVDNEQKQKYRC